MKRLAAFILLLALSGCSAGGAGPKGFPERSAVLPDTRVNELAGEPMKLAYERRDIPEGYACWAWEETEGLPRLLIVEIRFPPADGESLYEQAKTGAETIAVPDGASCCYDGRAAHLKTGLCYARIATLGLENEQETLRQVAAVLIDALKDMKPVKERQ